MEFDNDGDYAMMAEAEDMGQLATPRLKLRLDVPSSTKSYAAASPVSSMPPTTPLRIRLSLTAPPDLTHLGNDEQRVARHAIEQLRNHPAAAAFLLPVDTVAYPNYTQLVSNPVDLTTIRKRFDSDKYQSLGDLARDIRLVFTNCYIFNVEGSHVYTQAKKLEAFYTNEIEALLLAPKDQPAGLTEDEKRRASLMLSKLLSQPFSYFFSSPVDPVRDGAPDYLEVVEHP